MASHGVPRGPRTRTDEQKRLDSEKIQKYHELEAEIRSSAAYDEKVFANTTRLLRLNPEYYTTAAWVAVLGCAFDYISDRNLDLLLRRLFRYALGHEPIEPRVGPDDVLNIVDELQFTIPLLLEFPKCYWIWSYRLWVLEQAVTRLDVPRARQIWEDELALDSKMLTKDRRNFHAWGYRRQVVERLESEDLTVDTTTTTSLVEPEFEYTTKMIHRDLSNFSAWHNRSKLIPRLLAERNADDAARKAFFEDELNIIREALNVGPEDQSLWFYHQFLMLDLIEYTGRPTMVPHLTLEERMAYIARELEDIRDLLTDYDDVKWIYEALFEYTLAVAKMENRSLSEAERVEVQAWLAQLRKLDPKRNGRWDDLEMEYIRGRKPHFEQESISI
ncbi:Rab geranylgeranyltransferase [Sporothrix bragantina]|uniref:Geranylgeranyl transferase type-2 subunit alpha n=1 Tax=Sporothrix bragantina TaxID=671064 RepID=A0ABP0BNG2_9PEZI